MGARGAASFGARPRARVTALVVACAALLGIVLPSGVAVAVGHGDPYRAEQWNLDRIRVDAAWEVTRGAGATIAIVDTGVALDHPDLVDRLVRRPDGSVLGLDLVDGGDPGDRHGHGTLVAGIAAATADDGYGIAGVAPEARILPVRVLDGRGSGRSADVGRAIRWAVDHGADVVNVSLEAVAAADGSRSAPGVPDDAVRYADERGVVVVAAAGNEPGAAASYPEDSPIVLVGAVDRDDRSAPFSSVDRRDGLVAPGVGIISTWCRRTEDGCDVAAAPFGVAEGTSFAAPHVSGIAALLVANGHDAAGVRERLAAGALDLGDPGPDRTYGAGRVDAARSLGVGRAAPSRSSPGGSSDGPQPARPGGAPPEPAPPEPAPPEPARDPAPPAAAPVPPAPPAPVTVEEVAEPAVEAPAEDVARGSDEDTTLVSLETRRAAPAAGTGRGPVGIGEGWVQLLATALVLATLRCWSVLARAER